MVQQGDFKNFKASTLFCPKCKQANEVRERLLLVLPDGDLFDYFCSLCGTSVGKRKVSDKEDKSIVLAPG